MEHINQENKTMAWNKLLICSFLVFWVTDSSKAQIRDNTRVETDIDAAVSKIFFLALK